MSDRGGLLTLLIPDEIGQRAIDEAAADWRAERRVTSDLVARFIIDVRGAASIVRVLALTGTSGLRSPELWRFTFLTLLVAGAIVIAPVIVYLTSLFGEFHFVPGEMLALIPSGLVVTLSLMAGFGLGLRPDRLFPALTATGAGLVAMLLLAGYMVPNSNQYFREQVVARVSPPARPSTLSRGIAEASLTTLVRQTFSDDLEVRQRARRTLSMRMAFVVALPTAMMLGVSLRRVIRLRRWWVTQVLSGVLTAAVLIAGGFTGLPVTSPGSGTLWFAIAFGVAAIVVLARLFPIPRSEPSRPPRSPDSSRSS